MVVVRAVEDWEVRKMLADKDVRGVFKKFRRSYRTLDKDEAWSRCLAALFRALGSHKPGIQKFTTSLWRFCRWEFESARTAAEKHCCARLSPRHKCRRSAGSPEDDLEHVKGRLSRLPDWASSLLMKVLVEKEKLEEQFPGKSARTCKAILAEAVALAREACSDESGRGSGSPVAGLAEGQCSIFGSEERAEKEPERWM